MRKVSTNRLCADVRIDSPIQFQSAGARNSQPMAARSTHRTKSHRVTHRRPITVSVVARVGGNVPEPGEFQIPFFTPRKEGQALEGSFKASGKTVVITGGSQVRPLTSLHAVPC